jgi:hypothetical protein
MRLDRIGKLLFAYQTDVYFQVHEYALKTIIKLDNKQIPFLICRNSIQNHTPIFQVIPDVPIWSEPPFYFQAHDKEEWTTGDKKLPVSVEQSFNATHIKLT